MPLIPYTLNVPNPPHNPSADVGDMQSNTNAIDTIISQDHFSFNTTNFGGLHQQSTYVNTVPTPTTVPGQVATFARNTVNGNVLAMVRDGVLGTLVNLTTAKISVPVAAAIGVTWFPAEILIQWGFVNSTAATFQTLNFPTPFPNACFIILTQPYSNNTVPGSQATVDIRQASVAPNSFEWAFITNSAQYTGFFWCAIGN